MVPKKEGIAKTQTIYAVVLFLVVGGLLGAATYVSFIPQQARLALKFIIAAACLIGWLITSRQSRLRTYSQIVQGFFAVSIGILLAKYFGNIPNMLSGFTLLTVQGVAMAKFGEALFIVLPILLLHFATGGDRNGLFLGKGNLKLTIGAGIAGFLVFAGIGILQAAGFGLSTSVLIAAIPWTLVFIFSNAFMEELWFRALFLKKLEPLVGARTALIITTIVFATVHISSTYVVSIILFILMLMVLGFFWGWLMQKSDSIWGPVLIHAGADILVIYGFLAGAKL